MFYNNIYIYIYLGTNYRFRTFVGTHRGGNGSVFPTITDSWFCKMGFKIFHSILHKAIYATGAKRLQITDDRFDESMVPSYQNQSNRIGRRGNYGIDCPIKPEH